MTMLLARGPLHAPNGGQATPPTAGHTGAMRVQSSHAEHYDAAFEGRLFSLDSDSVTIASANATKSALGTAKFVNGFYNPANSGKNAVILAAALATVSGTPGGPFFYNTIAGVVPTSASTGTIRSNVLGSGLASLMVPLVGVVIAVVGGATTALTQFGVLGGPAAIAAGAGNNSIVDNVRGAIIVPPGTLFGIMALAAGTSHIVQSTLSWDEIKAY